MNPQTHAARVETDAPEADRVETQTKQNTRSTELFSVKPGRGNLLGSSRMHAEAGLYFISRLPSLEIQPFRSMTTLAITRS
jgi:hypothetical protein